MEFNNPKILPPLTSDESTWEEIDKFFIEIISNLHIYNEFRTKITEVNYPAGRLLLQRGELITNFFYLKSGVVYSHGGFDKKKKSHTDIKGFWADEELIYSKYCEVTYKPKITLQKISPETIELLTDSTIRFISAQDLEKIFRKSIGFRDVGIKMFQEFANYLFGYMELMRAKVSSEAKVKWFFKKYGEKYHDEKPLTYYLVDEMISTYLGISRQHFNKIRTEINKKN